jgi:hypothetical protein
MKYLKKYNENIDFDDIDEEEYDYDYDKVYIAKDMNMDDIRKLLEIGDKLLCLIVKINGEYHKNVICYVRYFSGAYFCLEFEENVGGHGGEPYYTETHKKGHSWCITPGHKYNYEFKFKKLS